MVLAGLQQQWLLPSRRAAATAPRAFAPPLALPLRRMRRQAPSFRCRAATALNAPMAAAVPEVPRSEQQQRRRAVVARTSADWWEDEEEYDAITEILDPKRVFLLTPEAAAARPPPPAIAAAAPRLVTAFASERALGAAEALWQELGRAGPPLFLKVRARAPLTELDGDGGSGGKAAAEAAEAFWAEALSQSWRTELDYGLGRRDEGAAEEALLVVAGARCLGALAAALSADGAGGSSSAAAATAEEEAAGAALEAGGGVLEVEVGGWNQGLAAEQQRVLESWRALAPRVVATAARRG